MPTNQQPDLATEARELLAKATPGRWRWNINLDAKEIKLEAKDGPRQYVIDFVRWGMNGAQPRFQINGLMQDAQDCAVVVEGREHHASWFQTLDHPDANLIARAPELIRQLADEVERLRRQVRQIAQDAYEDTQASANEAYWREVQGEDHGSY